jgi:hypothetical protein
MRASIAVLTFALALAVPAAAHAKEIASVSVCGAAGCDDVTTIATPATLDGGGRGNPPGSAAPFYRVKVRVRAADEERVGWTFLYVPSVQKVRGDDGTWMNPTSESLRALDRIVAGRRPLPASRLVLPTASAETAAPPTPARPSGGVPAAVWAFGAAGAAALAACALLLVLRRRGPTAV